jgi:hypothetical protein
VEERCDRVREAGEVLRIGQAGDPDELEPASDLEFLVHLVGDIHQPLHAATDKDRGGNCLFVTFRTTEGETSMRKKFHGVMDGASSRIVMG